MRLQLLNEQQDGGGAVGRQDARLALERNERLEHPHENGEPLRGT